MKISVTLMVCGALLAAGARGQQPDAEARKDAADPAKKAGFNQRLLSIYDARESHGLLYRLMKPIDYNPATSYPLIVSLHGAGGRGMDNNGNIGVGWTDILAQDELRREHPCFVFAPQTPNSWGVAGEKSPELTDEALKTYPEAWQKLYQRRLASKKKGEPSTTRFAGGDLLKVFDIIAELEQEFPIDRDRVYVLGHSMGGMGTWNAIYERPELFAAAIPTAGGLSPWKDPKRFASVPIWAFHGAADPTVPVELTKILFDAMKECGGNMKFTELKGVNHNLNRVAFDYKGDDPDKGWITSYSSEKCDKEGDVWDWLFKQKRSRSTRAD